MKYIGTVTIAKGVTVTFDDLVGINPDEIITSVLRDNQAIVESDKYQTVLSWRAGQSIDYLLNQAKQSADFHQEKFRKQSFTAIGRTSFYWMLELFHYIDDPNRLVNISGRQAKLVVKWLKAGDDLSTALGNLKDEKVIEQLKLERERAKACKKECNDACDLAEIAGDKARDFSLNARQHVSAADWTDRYAPMENAVYDEVAATKKAARKHDPGATATAAKKAMESLRTFHEAVKRILPPGYVPDDSHVSVDTPDDNPPDDMLDLETATTFDVTDDGSGNGLVHITGDCAKALPRTVKTVFVRPGTRIKIVDPNGNVSALTVEAGVEIPALLFIVSSS